MSEPIDASVHPELTHLESRLLARQGRRDGREIRFRCLVHEDVHPSARWNPLKATWYCDVCRRGGGWRKLIELLDAADGPVTVAAAQQATVAEDNSPGERDGAGWAADAADVATAGSGTAGAGGLAATTGAARGTSGGGTGPRRVLVATYRYTDATGRLLYEVQRYAPKTFCCRRPDGRGGWLWNLQGVEKTLYRLPEVAAAIGRGEMIFLVEGEKDADTLAALGFTATTHPGGAGRWLPAHTAALRGARVVILPDNDEPGRRHADQVTAAVAGAAAEVRRLELPDLPPKGDVSDWLDAARRQGLSHDQVRCQLLDLALGAASPADVTGAPGRTGAGGRGQESAPCPASAPAGAMDAPFVPAGSANARPPATSRPADPPGPPPAGRAGLHGVRLASEIAPRRIDYLWEPYIARRKLTLLDGDPGEGKSWLTAAIAAAGSRGCALPGLPGRAAFAPFRTLFLCEDEGEDILRPRLDRLGADNSLILVRDALSAEPLYLATAAGAGKLDEILAAYRPALVVIDPIQAFGRRPGTGRGGARSHGPRGARTMTRAQELLAALAERGIAVVVEGAQLRVSPRSALNPVLIERILECRHELITACGGPRSESELAERMRPPLGKARPLDRRLVRDGQRLGPLPTPQPPIATRPPGHPPVERWLLWTLAAAPGLTRAALQSQVERAITALLERGEVRCRGDGSLTLNSQ